MLELHQIGAQSYYIQSPAKIGLVKTGEHEVCLIDSGNDKDAGRKVRRILDAHGWTLKAIYNTHSNADHIGGNKYLQSQTGCRVFAPGIDCDFTRHPILEPAFLYGGFPPKELQHKFLLAQESDAEPLTKEALPDGWELIELPGHFFDMVGFRMPDNVVYLADCLSSRETLDKYQIGFIYDVAAYLETLERVKSMNAALFVPAHAEAAKEIAPLAQYNIDKVMEIAERILSLCGEPRCFEAVLREFFVGYGLAMNLSSTFLSEARCAPIFPGSLIRGSLRPASKMGCCFGTGSSTAKDNLVRECIPKNWRNVYEKQTFKQAFSDCSGLYHADFCVYCYFSKLCRQETFW